MVLAPALLAACVSGGANLPVEPSAIPTTLNGVLTSSAANLAFSGTGPVYAQTFNLSFPGYTGTVTIAPQTCAGPPAIVTFDKTTFTLPTTVTVTPQNVGTCSFTVSVNPSASVTIGVTVNAAGVVISGRHR